jgi:hypothetical protein
MQLTFLVTIDPVKDLALLKASIHSLKLQTCRNFSVIFHNQTLCEVTAIFERLGIRPEFEYSVAAVPRADFFGAFPLWDLYAVHAAALRTSQFGDYFMSVHMEEFFEPEYVERASLVLETAGLDLLFGNLNRTWLDAGSVDRIVAARTPGELTAFLRRSGLQRAPHFAFHNDSEAVIDRLKSIVRRRSVFKDFGWRTRLAPTATGHTQLSSYYEDLYFMRTDFARRSDWFLSGKHLYFEDVHICQRPGVCELAPELSKLTRFPVYLNASRAYHLQHRRFYYQLEDPTFTDRILALRADDPALRSLQKAIEMYRAGQMTRAQALSYTRANPELTGTQNLNYRYHMEALRRLRAA